MNASQPSGTGDSNWLKILYSGQTTERFLSCLPQDSLYGLIGFFSVRRMDQMIQNFSERQQIWKQDKNNIGNEKTHQ